MPDPFLDDDYLPYEEESLFARDHRDQLIRLEKPTREMYEQRITLTIDGHEVDMPKAVPATDALGTVLRDADGRTVPRSTTIYDAANELVRRGKLTRNPIPILCHQDHMKPIGVCRVCSVQVFKRDGKGTETPEKKLVPACQYPLQYALKDAEVSLIVHTVESKDVEATKTLLPSVKMLVELLLTDHHHPDRQTSMPAGEDELWRLAQRLGVQANRLPKRPATTPKADPSRLIDDSSKLIAIDLNSCILCNRCVRGCDEVQNNQVISRTGKGFDTKISFDLNEPMGQSSCISCGECFISCPTSALTLKAAPITAPLPPGAEPVSAEELRAHPLFAGIPYKFLQWNAHGVWRRRIKAGDVLYWAGEIGNTAFTYDVKGEYLFGSELGRWAGGTLQKSQSPSLLSRFLGHFSVVLRGTGPAGPQAAANALGTRSLARRQDGSIAIRTDGLAATGSLGGGGLFQQRDKTTDPIMGEMTCLYSYPRAATVKAIVDSVVLEFRRNVLRMILRNPLTRAVIDETLRKSALEAYLLSMPLFAKLGEKHRRATVEFLRSRIEFERIEAGQVIYRQRDKADALCFVRVGFVKVAQRFHQQEVVQDYVGPGGVFGEVALMASFSDRVAAELPPGFPPGCVTATYSALDYVELVKIPRQHFTEVCEREPGLRSRLEEISIELLREMRDNLKPLAIPEEQLRSDYLAQGLFKGQDLLVLDLERCTRCDECTRACADSHGGNTRLIRDGERFDRFLVATSCRSCVNPTCMLGCPVDAIHRTTGKHITIEPWCIGCGLCSQNCPFGVINMVQAPAVDDQNRPIMDAQGLPEIKRVATACDLCSQVSPGRPNCVYACPHDAAFRMTAGELRAAVER